MNSRKIFLIIALALGGCGVRSKPLTPPETAIQSYIDSYIQPSSAEEKKEKKK